MQKTQIHGILSIQNQAESGHSPIQEKQRALQNVSYLSLT